MSGVAGLVGDAEVDGASSFCGSGTTHSYSSEESLGNRPVNAAMRELIRNGLFEENGSEAPGVVPLVDLWYDITNHLNQEDIPSPLELCKERDALSE